MSEEKRIPTSEKLALALERAGAPSTLIHNARYKMYDDWVSPHATPLIVLVADIRSQWPGSAGIAMTKRVMDGEFDGEDWEAEEFWKSPEGLEIQNRLLSEPGGSAVHRALFGPADPDPTPPKRKRKRK